MSSNKQFYYFYRTGDEGGCFAQWYNSKFTASGEHFEYLRNPSNAKFQLASEYEFCTAEQYMMFAKAFLFGDEDTAAQILKAHEPRKQKGLGRKVQGFTESQWTAVREEIVYQDNLLKFSQDKSIQEILLSTGKKTLVEASPTDSIWGIGFTERDAPSSRDKWGLNLLGKALVKVRETLREQEQPGT